MIDAYLGDLEVWQIGKLARFGIFYLPRFK